MTQPVLGVQSAPVVPVAAAAVASASEGGEPTIEELSALVPKAEAPVLEEGVEAAADGSVEPVEEKAAAEPAEVDAALERATKAAAKAREGSRRYAETQRKLSEQAYAAHQATQQAEAYRRENMAAYEREQALLKDPYKALKDRGMTDQQLAERAMRENSPEAATLRLEAALEQERAARVALENRIETERQNAIRETRAAQAQASFAAVADDEATYPRLAQLATNAQLAVARAALAQIAGNGYKVGHLTDAQIAEACERYLAPKRATKAATVAPVAKPLAKTSGKTLTNAMSQTRTVAPAQWDALTEEQQLAHIAAGLPEPAG